MKSHFVFYYPAPVWDGRREEQPLGGTWLSLINLTRELARQGYTVKVFSDCGKKTTTQHENLEYIPLKKFDCEKYPSDVFVSGRIMELDWDKINAHTKCLWAHDNEITDPLPQFQKGLDFIIVESKFHRSVLLKQHPHIPLDKIPIFYSPLAVDEYIIEPKTKYKGIYLSHPGRGLDNLLEIIPKIQKQAVDFYVMVLSSLLPYSYFDGNTSDEQMADAIKRMEKIKGVVWHRGLAQPALRKQLSTSYFHLYPTVFDEIFCYAALQACAAGTPPITTQTGVFPEWQELSAGAFYIINIDDANWKEHFADTVMRAMIDTCEWMDKAKKARRFIEANFRPDKVAQNWINLCQQ